MKFINPQVKRDLDAGRTIKLELGSGGPTSKDGLYSVDLLELDGVDIVADLNEPLDLLQDNCVEYIYSRHTLEHIDKLLPLMREIHRITKSTGVIEIIVPHFSNVYGLSDPTHVRFFGLFSMTYFTAPERQHRIRRLPAYYTDARFIVKSINIDFYRLGIIEKFFAPLFSMIVNMNIYTQNFYERRLSSFFHAKEIKYVMQPDK